MAAPADAARTATGITTATTAPVLNLPATINAGDTLFAIYRCAVAGAIGWPANWNEMFDASSDAADDQMAAAWKKADGTEGGGTITLSSGNGKGAGVVWRVTGAVDPTVTAPDISTVATGASTTPDPTSVNITGGPKDVLVLWVGGWEGEQTSPPASQPTNYSNPTGASSGTGGAVTTNARVAGASRQLTAASSEDPGSWTISVSDDWTVYAVAFQEAPPVVPPPFLTHPFRKGIRYTGPQAKPRRR